MLRKLLHLGGLLKELMLLQHNLYQGNGVENVLRQLVNIYLEFTLNPLLVRSRGVDEEGSQCLTRVILRPISQILVNVTLKLVDACGHNSTSLKSIPIVYYPLSERVLSYIKPRLV